MKIKQLPILAMILMVAAFLFSKIIFGGNEWMLATAIFTLQVVAGTISFIWLYQAYRRKTGKTKVFWFLMSVGAALYLSSNVLSLLLQFSGISGAASDITYLIWVISYLSFLTALIYRIKEVSLRHSNTSYIFNISIYMITASAISIHFLIHPVLKMAGDSWLYTAVAIAYPIADLSLLFVVGILYHLVQYKKENNFMMFIIAGFLAQVLADSLFVYLSLKENYFIGSMLDLLWLIALMLIGVGAYYEKDDKEKLDHAVMQEVETKGIIWPYASTLVLIVLVIYSYKWDLNVLSGGLLIVFLLIIGRQFTVIHKNNKLMQQFKFLAYHDSLTGLNNRVSFTERVEKEITERKDKRLALLLLDLDRFKVVNDTLGHYIGDQVLIKAAERLESRLNPLSSLYRMGGDEFVIVISEATEEYCAELARAIIQDFQEAFLVEDFEIGVTPSIGVSIYPENGKSSEDLFKNADAAMYRSKENGKNNYSFYNAELNKSITRKMLIETELKKAIEKQQLSLYYQPKIDLLNGRMVGMEALLRWEHPEIGFVSPAEFIPVAEETGQIIQIGEWVLNEACRQNKLWQDMGYQPLCVSVNVSVLQFQHGEFLKTVQKALLHSGMDSVFLELEITESIMQDINESKNILECLRKIGVKISIDDFGTGYSSLHILQRLPIDTLKIDKTFVDRIEEEKRHSMVKTIIDLGLNLNLSVVAEGIENRFQMDSLIENNCPIGQGYLFSRPVTPQEFEKLFETADFGQKRSSLSS